MVFDSINQKSKEFKKDSAKEVYSDINVADIDISMLDDVDLNSLRDELDIINGAIEKGSIELPHDELTKFKKDFNLISNILNEKYNVEDNSLSEETKKYNVKFENKVDVSDDLIVDDGDSVVDVTSTDGTESNFSFDDLVLNDNGDNGNSNSVSDDLVGNAYSNEFVLDNVIPDNTAEIEESDISVDDALGDLITNYSDDVVIKVENVSMDFSVSQDKIDTLKELFIRTIKRNKNPTRTVHALKNLSFEITKGDRVGIIGFNGAGKSTLLKLLSAVYYPTEGTIETKGKIAPLLELGAGFDNNYSGKDNIFLNGAFLGYSEDFLKEKYDEIVEFSELGDAINYHVKTYSSGMRAKLGFSIATIVEPDILILDEILSVGDIRFRRKSADKIKSLINSGITVLLVSHTVSQIRDLCNKAIWLDNGELKMYGNVNEVCDAYVKASIHATSKQLENLDFN